MNKDLLIFGLKDNFSKEDLKRSYRSLCKKYHPDVGGDENKFKIINDAYKRLSSLDIKQDTLDEANMPCLKCLNNKGKFCHPCSGNGYKMRRKKYDGILVSIRDECLSCNGKGFLKEASCNLCKGRGLISRESYEKYMLNFRYNI